MKSYSIALIPGDGIGRDVTAASLDGAGDRGQALRFCPDGNRVPWSCKFYKETGRMMPEDGIGKLRGFDAILLGAVGWPAEVPDSVSLHGLLLPIRKAFVQYANIRPHRLLPGLTGPLRAESFDILCIRENTEGEYSGAGGRVHQGTLDEVAVETSIFTRAGVERILRFGFRAGAGTARQAGLRHQVQRAEILDGLLGRDHAQAGGRLSSTSRSPAIMSTRSPRA
ncbi:isocitrate/isopropylmalate family dehydrogenase [Mesorhizobium atlanticum]